MEPEHLRTPSKFTLRIGKYTLIPFHFQFFFDDANLRGRLMENRMRGMEELSERFTPAMHPEKTPEELMAVKAEMREKFMVAAKKDVDEYLPILYNQALVMIITVFDVFLSDSLKTVTSKYPQLLKTMADEKDITILQIIDLADYDAIFRKIQSRVLKRFDYKSITERIAILKKLRVDIDAALAFKFHNLEVQKKHPDALGVVQNSYEKRHAIVHREQHTFDTYEQLEMVSDCFTNLVMSLSFAIGFRFDILTDWEKTFMVHPQRPKGGANSHLSL